jgi:hypothetical protein
MARTASLLGLAVVALQLVKRVAGATVAGAADGLLPRAAFQKVFNLPPAGSAAPSEYNLIMVADAGAWAGRKSATWARPPVRSSASHPTRCLPRAPSAAHRPRRGVLRPRHLRQPGPQL